jgi:UDP-2,3-diacylglucosamine hydrolase
MTTLFISDLHLDDSRPESTALFERFVRKEAFVAESLYILGDLFEYWLGDDVHTATSRRVAAVLGELKARSIPCFFMHGNRDFLLGEEYSAEAGMELLAETHLIDLYGKQTLLLHGDTLCTDDVEYMAMRAHIRTPDWRDMFLALSPDEREEKVHEGRQKSLNHQATLSMDIMDVNEPAVCEIFERFSVSQMIHGHTHRPDTHQHRPANGRARRFVLGDWYQNGSVLRASPDGLSLETYSS